MNFFRRWAPLARSVAAGAVLVGCVLLMWDRFWAPVPLQVSVLPHVLGAVGSVLLFCAASLGAGLRVTDWLLPGPRRDGHLLISFATGVLLFGLSVTLFGHLGLLKTPLFFVLPLMLLLTGVRPLVDLFFDGLSRLRGTVSLTPTRALLICAGLLGVLLCVAPTLDAANVNYDARLYHLSIAEQNVVAGAIRANLEGSNLMTGPHLASWLYTWAFLEVPAQLYDRVLLSNQIEVVCFLATLGLIPAAARLLRPPGLEARFPEAWVAFFLFPSIFIYDTGLMGGADRFAAFWATSAFIVWWWARATAGWRVWVLLGLQLSGAFLCKYTSIFFVVPLGLVIVGDALWRALRQRQRGPVAGPLVSLLTGFLCTAPYWLRNLAFYGNPVYPLAHGLFGGHPWTAHSDAWQLRYAKELFVPEDNSAWLRAKQTLTAVADHHLTIYTWPDMVGGAPVFGSVFACLVLLLPFVRGGGRLWVLAGLCASGIALWFNLAHQMRYLVIFVPLMAAAVAVLLAVVWSWGWFARAGVVAVVALQVLGTAEVPFFPTHHMNGRKASLTRVLEFLGRGEVERNQSRYHPFADMEDLGEKLPANARVLMHAVGPTMGLGRLSMTDVPGIELGLSYAEAGTLPGVYAKLRALGVTHVAWLDSWDQPDSPLGELLFKVFTRLAVRDRVTAGGWSAAALATEAPADVSDLVMVLGCDQNYPPGLYPRAALGRPLPPPNTAVARATPLEAPSVEGLARADTAIVMGACPAGIDLREFQSLGTSLGSSFWLRRSVLQRR